MRDIDAVDRIGAWTAAVVAVSGECVAVARLSGEERWNEIAVAPMVVAYAVVGLLIVRHQPRQIVGRLALWSAPALGVGEALVAASYSALSDHPASTSWAVVSVAGSALRLLAWLVVVLWLPLRFPDGRPARPGRLLRAGEVTVVGVAVSAVVMTLFDRTLNDVRLESIRNPLGTSGPLSAAADAAGPAVILLGVLSIVLAAACLVQRYRGGGPLDRQQTVLFGLAFIPPVAALVANFWTGQQWLFGLTTVALPVAIGAAVLQRRLYDIPLIVNRSLVYGILWVAIAGLYAVTVGGAGALVSPRAAAWLPWITAALVAVGFAPVRAALQRAANRATYGQWARPTDVLSRTSRRLADAGDQQTLLASLATELSEDLGLGGVEIRDADGGVLAAAGAGNVALSEELPLVAYGSTVGSLRWSRRDLRDADRALLADLSAQLGSVVHARGLLGSIRAAQERLVLAREEERRRLRRDLHDGLGPTLAGLSLRVDILRNELADPAADVHLLRLRSAIQDAVADVRHLVEGLRPASLDDLGLVAAVSQVARRVTEGHPEVLVDAEDLRPLPAAVEVAAYRIAQEALTNAVRHSGAGRVVVRLARDDGALSVTVSDDGSGTLRPRPDGLGMGSMRERAEEIGGSITVAAVPGRGTTVAARLPVMTEETG